MIKVAWLKDDTWVDEFGKAVDVKMILRIRVLTPAGTIQLDNGYEKYDAPVAIDATTGDVFVKPRTIDYFQSGDWYLRGPQQRRYAGRLSLAHRYVMNGQPLQLDNVKDLLKETS